MNRPAKIGIISNPMATRLRREMAAFSDHVSRYEQIYHHVLGDISDVPEILRSFAAEDVELVVINGGDGTVQAVVTSTINDQPFQRIPHFAVFPGGRTNVIAQDLGAGQSSVAQLEILMNLCADGGGGYRTEQRPFLKLELSPRAVPIYGALFGAATVVRGIEFCRSAFYPLGLPNVVSHALSSLYLSLLAIWPFKGPDSPMRAEPIAVRGLDGNSGPRPYFLMLATSLDRLILGIRTSAAVDPSGDAFNYVSIDYTFGSLLRAIPAMFFGVRGDSPDKGFIRQRVGSIEVDTSSAVTLDGEFYHPEPGFPIKISATEPFEFVRF